MKLHEQALNRMYDHYPNILNRVVMVQTWMPEISNFSIAVVARTVDYFVREWDRCPSLDEFMKRCESENKKQTSIRRKDSMNDCPVCDNGFITTDEDPYTVKPCRNCLPETYENWATGEYRLS